MPAFTAAYSTTTSFSAAIAAHFRAANRLHREVARVLRRNAIYGDPYASDSPPPGTLRQELRVIELLGQLPRDLQRDPTAKAMLRSALLTDAEPARTMRVYRG